jgi:prepilin-type N-terminal cleavage/methylation domain-containing protein
MSQPAKGLTLVELLVVLAIIAVLAALLLPAIQTARETARQVKCRNNVRQLGIALHNHHAVYDRFPIGWLETENSGRPGWAWGALLLPYLEESVPPSVEWAIGAPWGWGHGAGPPGGGPPGGGPPGGFPPGLAGLNIGHPSNREFRERSLSTFQCPSDPADDVFQLPPGGGPGAGNPPLFPIARANYTGVFGTRPIDRPPVEGNGMFSGSRAVRFQDVLDGTSNTLLVGERAASISTAGWIGSPTWVGAVPGAHRHMARVVGRADRVPNDVLGDFANFASHHPAGAHFVLVDGSVRRISDEIEASVFHALATRAGRD